MEEFIGTWKFQSSDNFEEYLKALGIPLPLRKLANLTSPTVIIKRVDGESWLDLIINSEFISNPDEKFSVTTDAVVRAITVTFKLGETVEENTVGNIIILYHVEVFIFQYTSLPIQNNIVLLIKWASKLTLTKS